MAKKKDSINKIIDRLESKRKVKTVFGYNKIVDRTKREVGDVWEVTDLKGNITVWTQHKGFRSKMSASAHAIREALGDYGKFKCLSGDDCKTEIPSKFDEKMSKISGMCADCHFANQTKMKVSGTFDEFALSKMKANIHAFLKDAAADVEALKVGLELSFVNVDGTSNSWTMENKEAYIKKIDHDFKLYKEQLYANYGMTEEMSD